VRATGLENTTIRRIELADAAALVAFYNGLSEASLRTFRPIHAPTTLERCTRLCVDNHVQVPTEFDVAAVRDGAVIGWSFLWHLDAHDPDEGPEFGLAVADAYHGLGIGTALTCHVLAWADAQRLPYITLIVVQDNTVAQHIYEKAGFIRYGAFVGKDDGLPYYRMRRNRGSGCCPGQAVQSLES